MTKREYYKLQPGDKVKIVNASCVRNEALKELLKDWWGKVLTICHFYEKPFGFTTVEDDQRALWAPEFIDHKLTAEELAELDKKPDYDRTKCCLNDEVPEQYDKAPEQPTPIKYFLFVEDGSIELNDIKNDIERCNPEIKVIVYRQGARVPELKEIGK